MAIEVVNRQRLARVDRRRLVRLAGETLAAVDRANASLTLAFVRDAAIRGLNRKYRGNDRATDVLSFPASDQYADDSPDAEHESLATWSSPPTTR